MGVSSHKTLQVLQFGTSSFPGELLLTVYQRTPDSRPTFAPATDQRKAQVTLECVLLEFERQRSKWPLRHSAMSGRPWQVMVLPQHMAVGHPVSSLMDTCEGQQAAARKSAGSRPAPG